MIDVDRNRILLSIQEPTATAPSVEAEVNHVPAMGWEEFCGFMNAHPKRRYDLSVTGTLSGAASEQGSST